jgi:hypothetical protein
MNSSGAQQRNKGGGKGSGKGTRNLANGVLCQCCGKMGHTKADCWNRAKDCEACGKTGHMKAVCNNPSPSQHVRGGNKQMQPRKPVTTATEGMTYAAAVTQRPWVCGLCTTFYTDPKTQACTKADCKGKRPQLDKPAQACATDKTFIKLQLLQPETANRPPTPDAAAEGLERRAAGTEATETNEAMDEDEEMADEEASEMEKLQAFITYGTAMGCCVKIAKAKLQALSPKLLSTIDVAKAAKDIAGERHRLTKQQETSEGDLKHKKEVNVARTKVLIERQTTL